MGHFRGPGLLGQVGAGHKACRADPKAAQEEPGEAAQDARGGDGVPWNPAWRYHRGG